MNQCNGCNKAANIKTKNSTAHHFPSNKLSKKTNVYSVFTSILVFSLLFHSVECRINRPISTANDDLLPTASAMHSSSFSTTTSTPFKNQTITPSFPPYNLVLEMAQLSHIIYKMKHWTSCTPPPSSTNVTDLPPGVQCHSYIHNKLMGTQVMIVSSSLYNYIAVVFAGTDDLRTVLSDGDILTTSFSGPLLPINHNNNNEDDDEKKEKIKVHAGFDHAVFNNDMFKTLADIVNCLKNNTYTLDNNVDRRKYNIITTGHSLGGADATLASASFSALYPMEEVTSITFGCPKVGLYEWSTYYNSLVTPSSNNTGTTTSHVSSYRFVLGKDIIPRLPSLPFHHVGHTIQMDDVVNGTLKAYYLHLGDEELGYVGVPSTWDVESVDVFDSLREHFMRKYVRYLEGRNGGIGMKDFYMDDFERVENEKKESGDGSDSDDDNDGLFGDDDIVHPKLMDW